eukprot:m.114987 g.114987  ORF g.114987 m.114987 type:complete len:634 (+) comp28389_c0_seq2:122-2023(+)
MSTQSDTCPHPGYLVYSPDNTAQTFSDGHEFKFSCDPGGKHCSIPFAYYVELIGGMVALLVIVMVSLCVESGGATWAQQLRCRCLPDPERKYSKLGISSKWPTRGPCCCCCCTPTCRKPGKSPRHCRPFLGILLAIASVTLYFSVLLMDFEEKSFVNTMDNFAKPGLLDIGVDFIGGVGVSVKSVSENATITIQALDTAFATIPNPPPEAVQVFNALGQTISVLQNVNVQIETQSQHLSYQLGNATDEIQTMIDRYDGIRHLIIVVLLGVVAALVGMNALVLLLHCASRARHPEAYHKWRFVYAPTVLLVLLVLWVLTIVYFALALLLSTVCIDPSGVITNVLNNTYSSGSYESFGEHPITVSFAFPIPDGVNIDITPLTNKKGVEKGQIELYNNATAITKCNLSPNESGAECLVVNVTHTSLQIIQYYLDCGKAARDDACLTHPLFAVELMLTELLQLVPKILSLTSTIEQGNVVWTNFTSHLNETFNALTGGAITATGSQRYGVLAAISCESINKPVQSLFILLCSELFTEIGNAEYYLFGMVIAMVVVEITTRGLYWRGEAKEFVAQEVSYADAIQLWNMADRPQENDDEEFDTDDDIDLNDVNNLKERSRAASRARLRKAKSGPEDDEL